MLLSTRKLRLQDPRKLHDRLVGQFTITDRIGQTAYRLDLTDRQALRSIHDVFHIGLLKPYKDNGMAASAPPIVVNEQ